MLTIIDYRLGNLGSIENMLRKLGHAAAVSSQPEDLRSADGLILPGVGAFDQGMRNLHDLGLVPVLQELVHERGVPVLGICLGAQLMTERSEEGVEPGLGWIPATTVRFDQARIPGLRVPSMGWSDVVATQDHWLLSGLPAEPRFYFVHSYHFEVRDPSQVLLHATYGYRFAAAFAARNIMGVQFHPEKSHRYGMALLDSFARHVGSAASRAA